MGKISRGIILLVVIGAFFGTVVDAQPIKAPAVITSPGVYELTEDAREITDVYGIQVQCSNVVIDGAGYFIGGEEREKSAGIYVNKYGGSITNITVKNLNLENWETGIEYNYVKGQEGDSNLITDCDIVKCDNGIHIEYSDYISIEENQIRDCSSGVVVEGLSTNTDLKKNTVKNCGTGVSVTNSQQTTLEENTINTCKVYGVEVTDSEGTVLKKNGVSDNKYAAVKFENSKNSEIIGNTFSQTEVGAVLIIGNDVHDAEITDNYFSSFENVVVDDVSTNIAWNKTQKPGTNILGGPYLGGNYWGSAVGAKGYSDTAVDIDGFGIADQPYRINEYNIDYLPLTHTTATKAPEEQEITPDTDDLNLTPDEINQTSEPSLISDNNTDVLPEPEVVTPSDTEKSTVQIDANTTNTSNVSILSTPAPVLTLNDSIMNRSVANAYPTANSQILQVSSPSNNSSGASYDSESEKGSFESSGNIISPATAIQDNLTLSAQNGFIVFLVSEAGGRVILTTTTGSEINLDPMQQKDLTVPVPVGGLEYTKYRIEKDGYTPVSGLISPYPGAGQTTTISVTLSKSAVNPSVLEPIQNEVKPSGINDNTTGVLDTENLSLPSGNNTEPSSLLITGMNVTDGVVANSSGVNQTITPPVYAVNTPVVAVTNGVSQISSTQPSYIISASAGPGGSIFPNGSVNVEDNGASSFLISPDGTHMISYLVIDGIQTSPMSEYRFMNVTSDHTITAGFA